MGVKFHDLVVRTPVNVSELVGKVIAVDAPNIIMGLLNFTRKEGDTPVTELILDRTQRPISHLYGVLYRVSFLYSKKIFPIFCFDGKDSDMKKLKTKDRLNDFRMVQWWYQQTFQSGDKILAKHLALSKEYLWQNVINESKSLLSAIGVPFIESPASAESQCAQLVKSKIAHFSNSQDFDSLLFGCPKLLQNFSKSLKRKIQGKWRYQKVIPYSISLNETLTHLGITYFQLVDMALMLETDYFPGIRSIGPKTALKLIKTYVTIESIINHSQNKYDFSLLTPTIIQNVRRIFLLPEVITKVEELNWTYPQEVKVMELLCEDHHLNQIRVKDNLDNLISNFETCKRYFETMGSTSRQVQTTLF